MHFDVNSNAVVKHANTLEKMHKSAFPVAVRGTLNKAAFNVKKDTLPRSAIRNFVNRSPNFFKAFSKVDMAKGFNVDSMKSTIGMTNQDLKGKNNYAVKDLEQQEEGGKIGGKSFIPMKDARGGGNARAVRPGNRMEAVNKRKLYNAAQGKGKNKGEKFIRTAIAAGKGGYVLTDSNRPVLLRITSFSRKKIKLKGRSNRMVIRSQALYSFRKKRKVSVGGTHFLREASIESATRLEKYFIEEAERQIEKLRTKY